MKKRFITMHLYKILTFASAVTITTALGAAPVEAPAAQAKKNPSVRAPETPAQHDARMAWWREAKFGLFIHWGLYAIPADGEWHMRSKKMTIAEYKKYAAEFNPIKFNADEWASVAHDAGMKYMVVTAKHHDGFAMYPSKASDYNLTDATPFKRDPFKELSLACPKYDVRFGVYYSVLADWGHPGGGAGCEKWDPAQNGGFDEYVEKVSLPQVKELLSNYGPISVMWFDSDGAKAPDPEKVGARYASVLKLQPNLIVRGGAGSFPADFYDHEGYIPLNTPTGDWELCCTANGSWGYTRQRANSLAKQLPFLIEAWSKGGNVLLNVGPDREGALPADSMELLKQIGAWMKVNGEAVYGSTRGPFDYLPWGWATLKGDMLYLFVLKWPKDGELRIPMETPITKAWLLTDPTKVLESQKCNGVTLLKVPVQASDPIASVIACKMGGIVPPYHSIRVEGPVTASEDARGAQSMVTGLWGMWGIEKDTGWVELDLGKTKTFSTVRLSTPSCKASSNDTILRNKSARIIVEVKSGAVWNKLIEADLPMNGKNREGLLVQGFEPVTARHVRVRVIAGTPKKNDAPDIWIRSFELF